MREWNDSGFLGFIVQVAFHSVIWAEGTGIEVQTGYRRSGLVQGSSDPP